MDTPLYDSIGQNYALARQPDTRIAAMIGAALGDARSVVNVGAGTGSYEPSDRAVIAIEPSDVMIKQRPPGSAPCIRGVAESLPLADRSVDAAMACLTLHHLTNWPQGLREMKRVSRNRIVLFTFDPKSLGFWLDQDYLPALLTIHQRMFPAIEDMENVLGPATIVTIPVPHDCTDGFCGAYWRRPAAYLDPKIRRSISAFALADGVEDAMQRLDDDLSSGRWKSRNADLMTMSELDIGYRLIVWQT
jgi:SAM-dependent methyltransferase